MGTRSQTYIHKGDLNSPVITCIYRQMDGYPTGMGDDIAKALGSRKFVNGIQDRATQINGMSCAAALLVSALKGGEAGNIYIEHPDSERSGCDYFYDLGVSEGVIQLRCSSSRSTLFEGPLSDFNGEKVENQEADEDA